MMSSFIVNNGYFVLKSMMLADAHYCCAKTFSQLKYPPHDPNKIPAKDCLPYEHQFNVALVFSFWVSQLSAAWNILSLHSNSRI